MNQRVESFARSVPHKRSRLIAASPIYYGWIILFSGTLGMMMTTPGQTVGVSIFLEDMIADLGVSRPTVSLMYSLATLGGSFALPFVGRFIDRRGPRYAVVVIAALFALACLWMGLITSLLTLFLGFLFIRGLGQGALSLVSVHVINIWFVRRRGLAVGILGLGMALATAAFPPFIESLIGQFGWRLAYMLLGGLVAGTVLPIGAWLFRERPEHYGLQPDGPVLPDSTQGGFEAEYTLSEARRTAKFWLFAAGSFCVAAFGTGLVFHHYSIMAGGGVDREVAAMVFVPFGMVMAGANLVTGILMDRVPPRLLLSPMLALLSASLLLATRVTSIEGALLYGSLLGLMQGMHGAIQASVYAHLFGRTHIGSIKGFATTISVAGAALGPFLFALGLNAFGSYAPILSLSALAPAAVAIVAPIHRNVDTVQ